ncbi:MAG: PKD domain-containing protein [Bacteroidota bacterium]|nr:PKD domain-containing protein [Bacteroidota bacterium]
MKSILCIVLFLFIANLCRATHIVGGEVFYQYISSDGSGNSTYKVSMRLFRDCLVQCGDGTNVACLPAQTVIAVYENGTNTFTKELYLPLTDDQTLSLNPALLGDYPPCITTKPPLCYEVKTYSTTVTLADNNMGYTLAYENCCRATTLNVLNNNEYSVQGLPGVTYDCSIPGKKLLPTGHNSTAVFNLKKPDLICYNSHFTLDYGATDPDVGDSVSFAFQPAYSSGALFGGANDAQPAETPPYSFVGYNTSQNFSGSSPLGSKVTINPVTGQITGTSPAAGLYVVSVVVYEWRNRVNIAQHRKDFILRVENCNVPQAVLNPSYITCNGFDLTFSNESTSANINSYYWNFGDPASSDSISTLPLVSHTYSKAGTYNVTLVINKGGECSATATAEANVFPGFVAKFSVSGSCVQNAFVFTDKSTTVYGVVNGWRWNFGDPASTADTSILQSPQPYRYSDTGTVTAQLIVSNSKGCLDTLTQPVIVYEKPTIALPFHDTLICNIDHLLLSASTDVSTATYTWTPLSGIRGANTSSPEVNPQTSTTYYVNIDAGSGCVNQDSVRVNVTDKVILVLPKDTTICLTDTMQLTPISNALKFAWSPSSTLSDSIAEFPFATPSVNTTYRVRASIGTCFTDGETTVNTAPYPVAVAGMALPVCFGSTTKLNASYTGTAFAWSPVNSLLNYNTLTPTAGPQQTTVYTFTAYDRSVGGCPKPVSDTVSVVVIPPVQVFAGNDTNVVAGQPLQLNATGASTYQWSPSTGMNNSNIANPVVNLPDEIQEITYAVKGVSVQGCVGYDSVKVYQFKTVPQIFIPSAFTPDGDGINDILKPVVAGIKQFENFSIYNRLGQLLFTTPSVGVGWDGNYKGVKQPPGTYVYLATATDYLNRHLVKRGTVVLIR